VFLWEVNSPKNRLSLVFYSFFGRFVLPYSFCIFDFDGTLTDPRVGLTKSYQYALAAFGIHEELDSLERCIGPPIRDNFRLFYGFSDSDTELAVAKFREYFTQAGLYENMLYPGILDLLQVLRDNGRTLAIATNKTTVYTQLTLDHFDFGGFFDFVSGDEMDGSLTKHGKREIIRIALDALDPGRCLQAVMIGDRKHDITGAVENGIDSIGVTYGYGARSELEGAGASWVLDSLDEIRDVILGGS